ASQDESARRKKASMDVPGVPWMKPNPIEARPTGFKRPGLAAVLTLATAARLTGENEFCEH
ncbi:MAG TPA: hypothetical protein VNT42_10620, partial [Sphingomonas sp.]|nr:hypothetical protein [Sphingomonas sp.]